MVYAGIFKEVRSENAILSFLKIYVHLKLTSQWVLISHSIPVMLLKHSHSVHFKSDPYPTMDMSSLPFFCSSYLVYRYTELLAMTREDAPYSKQINSI